MKNVDYIIVGCGLAGISFCETLREHHKTFVVFNDNSQQSSMVAAGLYNPVVLKRFTPVWKANEQLDIAQNFYAGLEQLLNVKLDYKLPVYRKFASVEEQNNWFDACDKPILEYYLHPKVVKNHNPSINAPFGFGKVKNAGRVDTMVLITHYIDYLKTINCYVDAPFEHSGVAIQKETVQYQDIRARFIVFAEGFGMVKNPYFNTLSLNVAKGEVVHIHAPNLNIDFIVKSSVFVVPEGNDKYSVGSTYNWEDKTNAITTGARAELLGKLNEFVNCDYEVINQVAGIRPTVKDRRPLVGVHPEHRNLALLNGLGTRGVMIGPYVARQLFQYLENGLPLAPEIDVKRYFSK